jgi:hypothetical protein
MFDHRPNYGADESNLPSMPKGQQHRLRHVFMIFGVVDETIYVFRHPCVSSFLFRTKRAR